MRAYRCYGPLGLTTFARTQKEAEAIGAAELIDVPIDQRGLVAFLNELAEGERAAATAAPAEQAEPPRPGVCPVCDRTGSAAAMVAESGDLEAIKGFILDRATPVQVEEIFSGLGARFHELRKAAEARR